MLAGSSFQSSFKNIQLQFELMKYVLDHQRYGVWEILWQRALTPGSATNTSHGICLYGVIYVN